MLRSLLTRSLVALGLTSCTSAPAAEPTRTAGQLADVPSHLAALHQASEPDAYLIIEVQGTEDFLQFTASPTVVELDLPLVTERQQSLEEPFRAAAADLGLAVRDSRGSEGSRFLDIDLEPGSAGARRSSSHASTVFGQRHRSSSSATGAARPPNKRGVQLFSVLQELSEA